MNYGQIVEQIKDLGFADESEIEEFETIVPNAINRSISEISMQFAPILKTFTITQPNGEDWDSTALYEYVMPEDFMKFADTPVKKMLSDGVYSRFNNFEIENGNTIIMSGAYEGTFDVFYVAQHELFDIDTEDEEPIPLPLKVHHLLPLLASYYIWLDDDQSKALEYYQRFQTGMQSAMEDKVKPRVRLATEWGGSNWL